MDISAFGIYKNRGGAAVKDGIWVYGDTLTDPINLNDVCTHENGAGFVANQSDTANPYSWTCKPTTTTPVMTTAPNGNTGVVGPNNAVVHTTSPLMILGVLAVAFFLFKD